MKLTILGTGNATVTECYNTCFVISDDDRHFMVDGGGGNTILHQLKAAGVNHCLSFEQVCDEWIEEYGIEEGTFDNISTCKYNVPTVLSIGRVYQTLILNVMELYEDVIEAIKKVYSSFISEEISNFNSNVYYSNPDYIKCSYEAGMLLD